MGSLQRGGNLDFSLLLAYYTRRSLPFLTGILKEKNNVWHPSSSNV
jgi:hypothetical protein